MNNYIVRYRAPSQFKRLPVNLLLFLFFFLFLFYLYILILVLNCIFAFGIPFSMSTFQKNKKREHNFHGHVTYQSVLHPNFPNQKSNVTLIGNGRCLCVHSINANA